MCFRTLHVPVAHKVICLWHTWMSCWEYGCISKLFWCYRWLSKLGCERMWRVASVFLGINTFFFQSQPIFYDWILASNALTLKEHRARTPAHQNTSTPEPSGILAKSRSTIDELHKHKGGNGWVIKGFSTDSEGPRRNTSFTREFSKLFLFTQQGVYFSFKSGEGEDAGEVR